MWASGKSPNLVTYSGSAWGLYFWKIFVSAHTIRLERRHQANKHSPGTGVGSMIGPTANIDIASTPWHGLIHTSTCLQLTLLDRFYHHHCSAVLVLFFSFPLHFPFSSMSNKYLQSTYFCRCSIYESPFSLCLLLWHWQSILHSDSFLWNVMMILNFVLPNLKKQKYVRTFLKPI